MTHILIKNQQNFKLDAGTDKIELGLEGDTVLVELDKTNSCF